MTNIKYAVGTTVILMTLMMNIVLVINNLFSRRPACTSYGLGTEETLLNVNMLADKKSDDYCGVFINEKSEERSVAVAVSSIYYISILKLNILIVDGIVHWT